MKNPNIERFRELLDYDPETGFLRWRIRKGRALAGTIAGSICSNGYIDIKVDGEHFLAHRLAWAIMTGEWPINDIDHINGQKSHNIFVNLREAIRSENLYNSRKSLGNTSGFKGVNWHKRDRRWRATIVINKKYKHLGYFDTAEDAHKAYCDAADKWHGKFSNHG